MPLRSRLKNRVQRSHGLKQPQNSGRRLGSASPPHLSVPPAITSEILPLVRCIGLCYTPSQKLATETLGQQSPALSALLQHAATGSQRWVFRTVSQALEQWPGCPERCLPRAACQRLHAMPKMRAKERGSLANCGVGLAAEL